MLAECRFCLDEDDKNRMISPCLCSGTQKWVHSTCLQQWRKKSVTNSNTSNRNTCCGTCRFNYVIEYNMRDHLAYYQRIILRLVQELLVHLVKQLFQPTCLWLFFILLGKLSPYVEYAYYCFELIIWMDIVGMVLCSVPYQILGIRIARQMGYWCGLLCCIFTSSLILYVSFASASTHASIASSCMPLSLSSLGMVWISYNFMVAHEYWCKQNQSENGVVTLLTAEGQHVLSTCAGESRLGYLVLFLLLGTCFRILGSIFALLDKLEIEYSHCLLLKPMGNVCSVPKD
jgi:hypothetical protein